MDEFLAKIRTTQGGMASPGHSRASTDWAIADREIIAVLTAEAGLRVVLQPQSNLANQRVMGAEALTRWHHPRLGEIPASVLIPAVERLGLGLVLFRRVFAQVVHILCVLDAQAIVIPISVNASATTLSSPNLAENAARWMRDAGLSTARVRIELTEDIPISDPVALAGCLRQFTAQGFELAMDDFGVGISTMQLLTQIPFSELKIDRQFIRRLRSDSACRAVIFAAISLGRTLGMRVVAEGVEDIRDIPMLWEMGCEIGQGYALHPPLEVAAFLKLARGTAACSYEIPHSRLAHRPR